MMEYHAEGRCLSVEGLSRDALRAACAAGEIVQGTAVAFDHLHRLHVQLGGSTAVMDWPECADGAAEGRVRQAAVLSRVGKPACFVIEDITEGAEGPEYRLSRRRAQQRCREDYLSLLEAGDVIPCTVTHLASFGAFCDVGCGISALLPIDCLSVSRISSPSDRVAVGQELLCAVKGRDGQGRLVLTLRELLGTWEENAARFHAGETVVGIVRSVEEYGVFIEIAPNLAGLAECSSGLFPGQAVSVYIKSILPRRMKLKLSVVDRHLSADIRFELHYFIREGPIGHWVYSTPESGKHIETVFARPALCP